ncbi:MAG: hypothetical protein WDN69_21020 [Aliidongia sp.]
MRSIRAAPPLPEKSSGAISSCSAASATTSTLPCSVEAGWISTDLTQLRWQFEPRAVQALVQRVGLRGRARPAPRSVETRRRRMA